MKLAISTFILFWLLHSAAARAGKGIIHNETPWTDTSGQEIWCNGGHIIREGDLFYWIGYDTGPGRWPWRINLYSSRNLADWKFENIVMRMEGNYARLGWAGRQALLHCQTTGNYIIVFEADSPSQWKRHKVGFAACDRINGQYELVNTQSPEETRSTGDQSVYQEGDKAYVLATMDKDSGGNKYLNQSLAIFELSQDFLRIERKVFEGFENISGNKNVVPRDHSSREASHIMKMSGVYYWFSSALVGWNSSATMYATATDLAGPWSELKLLRTEPPSQDSYKPSMILFFQWLVLRLRPLYTLVTVIASGLRKDWDATYSCRLSGKTVRRYYVGTRLGRWTWSVVGSPP